ncbi:MAG: cobalamin-dependent protein, partial [Planctomycetota bacterium]
AIDQVLAAVDDGLSLRAAYTDVVLPVLQEVGRGWLVGEVSIGEEHFATATTEALLARLQERAPARPQKNLVVVGAALENNDHDIGLRIVMDFFDMDGWRPVFLGAGMPTADLAQALIDFEANLLALTVTLAPQLETAKQLIAFLRHHEETKSIKVLVGGSAFRSSPELLKEVGADALAEDPEQAVKIGNQLLR